MMGLLAPLAALLGLEVEGIMARARSSAVVYGLIGLFVFIALGFLLAAAFMVIAESVGSIAAALIMGCSFVVLALAVYLGSLIGRSRRQRKLAERRRSSETGAFLTTAAITALPMLTRSPILVRLGLPAVAIAIYALLRENKDD
jgi:hypothetical protein